MILKIPPTTCVTCLNKYIRTQGRSQEQCLLCQRKEHPEDYRELTAKLNRRREKIDKEVKRFGKYYGFLND